MDELIEGIQAQLQEAENAEKTSEETALETTTQTVEETATQTGGETIVETEGETANTAQKQRKTAKSDPLEKSLEKASEKIEKDLDESFENDDSLGDDDGIEEASDPLLDMVQEPEPTTIEEEVEKSRGASTKSLNTLITLGEMLMDYVDNSKALLCSAISGKDAALYASDQKAKKALIEATKNYVQEIGIKPPTPTQTFLLAVAVWLLPSLGMASLERFQLGRAKRKEKAANSDNVQETESAEAVKDETPYQGSAVDYSQCKEYQEKRRLFNRHANGTYRHLIDGTYANVDLAREHPSPEILTLLNQGLSNVEIRQILYGE